MDHRREAQEQALAGDTPAEVQRLSDDIWLLPRPLGNTVLVATKEGAAVIDPGLEANGPRVREELRRRTQAPLRLIIYTHGHADHAFGTGALLKDAAERGDPPPDIVGHKRVRDRFDVYQRLQGRQEFINRIQFAIPAAVQAFPRSYYYPTITYEDRIAFRIGGLTLECRHGMGETDDATWVSIAERSMIVSGDFLIQGCPNVGNPFKVQRYAREWAQALEEMAALGAEIVVPGHGPVLGREAGIEQMLETARALRYLEDEVVRRLNEGQWQEQILEEVDLPPDLKEKPYLAPTYGCPRFVVHGIIRRYAGWYDGNPSDLFPSTRAEVAQDVLAAAGGPPSLLERARSLRDAGGIRNLQRALHLTDYVLFGEGDAGPYAREAHALKAELLEARAQAEPSFIARNIFANGAKSERGFEAPQGEGQA